MARPTSRSARAKRVTESTSSSTRWPRSRKYSAIAVPTQAARLRSSAGRSEVATTTTERASPASPRLSWMNSLTSRPRSPTSTITLTSASPPRASMPSRVLLPPPATAKMPTRWPSPVVITPSIARTPVENGRAISLRVSGFGEAA